VAPYHHAEPVAQPPAPYGAPATRHARSADVDVADTRPGPEESAEESEASRALVVLLEQLPEHQRVPVVLRHVVGLSYAEIASTVHCPVGTAKANVARGLERLRVLACAPAAPGRRSSSARRPRQLVRGKEAR